MSFFKLTNVHKSYEKRTGDVEVLRGLDFEMKNGEAVGIYGASGVGKSTFLHILGGLDKPDIGSVFSEGTDIYNMGEKWLARFRNKTVGFVFQFYYLLPEFNSVENVMMPKLISGVQTKAARDEAEYMLEKVGLKGRLSHRPGELSGGEQQRVAIARALIMKPRVILADEPTGNLDEETGSKVFSLLMDIKKEVNAGLVLVTHNPEILKSMERKLELKGGRLHELQLLTT